jgi:hypothetical protein
MSDAECIQAAYEDAMQANFKLLMAALVQQSQNEAVAQFTKAVQLAKTAKTLALGLLDAPPPTAAADQMPGQKRQRRAARQP